MGRSALEVGIIPNPVETPCWDRIKAFLEPARIRGGEAALIKPHGLVWGAFEGGEMVAAVTAYVTTDRAVEIVLGGGTGLHWAEPIADRICDWARDEGAKVVRIIGRPGWARVFNMRVIERGEGCWTMERDLLA